MFIIVFVFALQPDTAYLWSDDHHKPARYATREVCEQKLVEVEARMEAMADKIGSEVPEHTTKCIFVEKVPKTTEPEKGEAENI